MKPIKLSLTALLAAFALHATAQTSNDSVSSKSERALPEWFPQISGTICGKMEYQTNEKEGRFEVRTARIAFDGRIVPMVEYKAEIDLSDEGKIKMLDAYAGVLPLKGMNLRLGQMRVPFSIDAHRSPHKQYFANRSFIAKQVGNVRDVGFYAAYHCQHSPEHRSRRVQRVGTDQSEGLLDQGVQLFSQTAVQTALRLHPSGIRTKVKSLGHFDLPVRRRHHLPARTFHSRMRIPSQAL